MKNTRKHKRLNAYYLMRYDQGSSDKAPEVSNITNLSAGGVKFFTERAMREQDTVRVSLLIPTLEKVFQADSKILRVRKLKTHLHYSVALRFENIRPEDQALLDEYIENLSGKPDIKIFIDHSDVVVRRS